MKYVTAPLLFLTLFATGTSKNKMDLLCHKWRQVGSKNFGREFKPVGSVVVEFITLNPNGTFEKQLYGQMSFKGKWKFSTDSTKLGYSITEINGEQTEDMTIEQVHPADSIMTLTADTLVCAHLGYYGPQKVYGHNDLYYVRDK